MSWQLTPDQFLSPSEVRRIMGTAQREAIAAKEQKRWHAQRDWTLLHIALGSGLRASELADLEVGDLILDPGAAYVIVRNGKRGKTRSVPVGEALRRHLKQYLLVRKELARDSTPFLLPGQRGGRWGRFGVGRAFKKLARRAGLPDRHSIHSCRHTFATMLLKSSGSLRTTQKALGHSSPEVTQIYADVAGEDMRRALDRLGSDLLPENGRTLSG